MKSIKTRPWLEALIALLLAALLPFLLTVALNLLGSALFDAWGVTSETLPYAPPWAQALAAHYALIVAALANALLLLLAMLLPRIHARGLPNRGSGEAAGGQTSPRGVSNRGSGEAGGGQIGARAGRYAGYGVLIGLLLAALLCGVCLALDLMRAGRRVSEGVWSASLIVPLAYYAAVAFGGEAFFRGYLGDVLAPYGRAVQIFVPALAFALLSGDLARPIVLLNGLLTGVLCGLFCEIGGGFTMAAAFRFGLLAALFVLMGCDGGAGSAVYETYARALPLVTGGRAGVMNGLGLAFWLAVGCTAAWGFIRRRRSA